MIASISSSDVGPTLASPSDSTITRLPALADSAAIACWYASSRPEPIAVEPSARSRSIAARIARCSAPLVAGSTTSVEPA
jgi:hypothetical protein